MKNLLLISFVVLTNMVISQQKQSISINKDWKFKPDDNLEYAKLAFDDQNWKKIEVDKNWEAQGYEKLDRFAWYRLKIFIPSSLKNKAELRDSLVFFMGKINNFDQTFLNGKIIGSNAKNVSENTVIDTSFLKAPQSMWNVERRYTLSVNDPRILWDKENVIAVRVFDESGLGGIFSGNLYIKMSQINEYLSVDYSIVPFMYNDNSISKEFSVTNTSKSYQIKGKLNQWFVNNLTGEKFDQKSETIDINPLSSKKVTVNLTKTDQPVTFKMEIDFDGSSQNWILNEQIPYILTPVESENPKINGPKVYGARKGNPFLYIIPATGKRPITFDAENLPKGLVVDKKTGIITGRAKENGEYTVKLFAKNSKGENIQNFKIVIGDKISLTPPMGWNSWNCWGLNVDESKVVSSAKTYIEKGLVNHGWSYINIDDGWQIHANVEPKRDSWGNILTNEKFKNMKSLGDSIHKLGLKFGIYSSPGSLTCGNYTGSYHHENYDAQSYSFWGVDYLKYDWCSYDQIAKDTSLAELKRPYLIMQEALAKTNRDIVYSLCQYGMGNVWEWGSSVGGNLWRTTEDITDTWESMKGIGFSQTTNAKYVKPGNWNDPDMLVVGWVGWGPNLHQTKLTPDEQYTHISLWSLLSAPLLIGCDLSRLDKFTLNLLTNDEVIAIDQDLLGKQATPVIVEGNIQIWLKELEDGGKAIGIFNLGKTPTNYILNLAKLNIKGNVQIRDVWRQKDLGKFNGKYNCVIPVHGVALVKIK